MQFVPVKFHNACGVDNDVVAAFCGTAFRFLLRVFNRFDCRCSFV